MQPTSPFDVRSRYRCEYLVVQIELENHDTDLKTILGIVWIRPLATTPLHEGQNAIQLVA
jgi:hypothetical protein